MASSDDSGSRQSHHSTRPEDPALSGDPELPSETKHQDACVRDLLADFYAKPQTRYEFDEELIGRSNSIKKLYEGVPICSCCVNWVEDYPEDTKDCIETTPEARSHALLVRIKKNHVGQSPTAIDSIVIQSPLLKVALQEILKYYPGISPELDHLVFEAPFECFFHRWGLLEIALEDLDSEAHKHLCLFHTILQEELRDTMSRHRDHTSHGLIRFDDLWTIFKPDDTIFHSPGRKEAHELSKLIKTHYDKDRREFTMELRGISWDGYDIGHIDSSLSIEYFAGTTPIRRLRGYPLKFHKNPTDLRQKLVARGRKFESLAGMRLVFYQGLAHVERRNLFERDFKFVEDGRIVLDAKFYQQHNPGETIWTTPFDVDSSEDGKAESDSTFKEFEMTPDLQTKTADLLSQNQPHCFDMLHRHGGQEDREDRRDADDLHSKDRPMLTEERLLLCSPCVWGFSLKSKRWAEYYVDDVQDIDWNDRAISSLILPREYKKLILAFVETQATYREDFDDVIAGKGQGIIMLLAGPPGTGKTLTAESVAEHLRVPLYIMSAGELGTDASSVEEKLSDIFDLTAEWKAVLLIDEADVFLESRNTRDLERNKLVSVFLRTLEYYKGVLFLTTNRIAAIDEAFESRIHLTIRYPQLDAAARKSVWANFIDVSQDSNSLSDESLTALAEEQISGRQIKNVVKTAQLLARTSKEALAEEHVRTVLRVIEENRSDFHPNDSSGAIIQ